MLPDHDASMYSWKMFVDSFFSHQSFAFILREQCISLSLSLFPLPFFSCFPTSTLKFPPSPVQKRNNYSYLPTNLVCPLSFSSFFPFFFFRSTSAHILRMLNRFVKGTRVHVRLTFWVSFDYHRLAQQQMLAIKVRKPLFFSVSLPERTCDPILLSSSQSAIDFPRGSSILATKPLFIFFLIDRKIEFHSPRKENFANETSNETKVTEFSMALVWRDESVEKQ